MCWICRRRSAPETALSILTQQGDTAYARYPEQMQMLRSAVRSAGGAVVGEPLRGMAVHAQSSSGGKGCRIPVVHDDGAVEKRRRWKPTRAALPELKHDTVLYGKQVMAEMGGGPPEELDDRGYVEPETEVYRRFAELAEQTADGLQTYGILDPADRENLTRLASLARSLETISRKELRNERLSDEEYDLIREYGGTLEHFWIEAVKDRTDAEYLDAREIPASLVTDIATDPNGTVFTGCERPPGADLCDRAGGRNAPHCLRRCV